MRLLEIKSDVFNCHDWQTGLAPLFLRVAEEEHNTSLALKTFFSIHNLAFQGLFPNSSFRYTNLPSEFNELDGIEFYEQISLSKGGIFFSDKIITVSPNYAKEILTPEFGCGMEGALKTRSSDLIGIANGIDTDVWDPSADDRLPANYSLSNLEGKRTSRSHLLNKLGLAETDNPVYGIVCRLTEQKGVDILLSQMSFFSKRDCRLIVLGMGDPRYERSLKRWAKAYPDKIAVCTVLDEAMSHLVEAGSDYYLMPSVFEPCGLNQMYSQRYGTPPLASAVGGLHDTIVDFREDADGGSGLLFEPSEQAFRSALEESLSIFGSKGEYDKMQANGMKRDFSWTNAAKEYEALYLDSI